MTPFNFLRCVVRVIKDARAARLRVRFGFLGCVLDVSSVRWEMNDVACGRVSGVVGKVQAETVLFLPTYDSTLERRKLENASMTSYTHKTAPSGLCRANAAKRRFRRRSLFHHKLFFFFSRETT